MSKISSQLLYDTLSVVQLARETAMQGGNKVQAERLNSVAVPLKGLVNSATETKAKAAPQAAASGVMAQSDFQALLNAAKTERSSSPANSTSPAAPAAHNVNSALERNRMVLAMGQSGMSDLDIARQMGMAREEVRLVLNIQQSAGVKEVK